MKISKKILKKLLDITNIIVSFLTFGKAKIYITNDKNPIIRYQEVSDFINKPLKANYLKKILFLEFNFRNLYSIYKFMSEKYGESTCDYVCLKSERDFLNIKKIFNYRIIVVNEELKFLDKISKKNQIVICIWHALGAFKKVGKYLSSVFKNDIERECYETYFNYLLVSGEEIRKLYADALNMKVENIISLGLPQVDSYFNKNIIEEMKNDFF